MLWTRRYEDAYNTICKIVSEYDELYEEEPDTIPSQELRGKY